MFDDLAIALDELLRNGPRYSNSRRSRRPPRPIPRPVTILYPHGRRRHRGLARRPPRRRPTPRRDPAHHSGRAADTPRIEGLSRFDNLGPIGMGGMGEVRRVGAGG